MTLLSVGTKVYKKSKKPFKSGGKVATIKDYGVHPTTGKDTYYFVEDDSYVECFRCIKYFNQLEE